MLITITLCFSVLFTACSSNDNKTTNESDSRTTQESNKNKSSSASGVDSELIGTWRGDAGELLAANTANLEGPSGLDCSGTINLTFTENASSGGGAITCSMPQANIQASGEVNWTCSSATKSNVLTNKDCKSTGTLTYGSQEIPMPEILSDGDAKYLIDGDTLKITFEDESVGNVTQTYTRT